MVDKPYIPRITFEVTLEQKERADKHLGLYGTRKAVLSNVLDSVLDLIEQHGSIVIGILMEKDKPKQVLKSLVQVQKKVEE